MKSARLKKKDVDLSFVISLLQSLQLLARELHDEFSGFESKAKATAIEADNADSTLSSRKHKCSIRITHFKGAAPETVLTGSNKFEVDTCLPVIYLLPQAMSHRLSACVTIHGYFSFLLELPELDSSSNEDSCKSLASVYSIDQNEKQFVTECQHVKHHICCQPTQQYEHQTNLPMPALHCVIKEDVWNRRFQTLRLL
jgi:hypothetical protein